MIYIFSSKNAAALGLDFGGIDLITDKNTRKTYLLEANSNAAFTGLSAACGIDIALEIINYISEELKKS